jgi:peptide/nickel transport system substrate-binding protein
LNQRFGKRDFILYAFMAVILVSIWLAMFQIDRQWAFIAQTQDRIAEQTRDIADLRRQLRQGIAVNPTQATRSGQVPDAWRGFARAQAAQNQPDYAEGDWLIMTFASQVPTLSPYLSGDRYATQVAERITDTLATRDPVTLEWLPYVAEAWEVSEDGLQIRFTIRDGVVFSDGAPLTAEDVAFSYRFVMDEKIAAPRTRAYFNRVRDVAVDGRDVTFFLAEPYFLAFEIIASNLQLLPKHFYEPYLESVAKAEEYNTSTGLLMGSGPYRLESPTDWKPGDLIELVRNERYWGWVTPPFERVIWKTIQSDAAQLTEFKNGGIDLYGALPLEYRDLIADERVMARAEGYQYYNPRGGYTYIAWNQRRDGAATVFADPRVRQAMTYLTDRQRLVDEIFIGYAQTANGPFNPLGRQHNTAIETRPFDPDRAKALLAEAGFVDADGDGVIETPDGKPFRFQITYPSGSDNYKRIMLLLKDLYVRAGILMEPNPVDWPVLINALNNKDFDAISLAWTSDFEIDLYQFFHSSQTEPGGDNFASYINPELDALIEQARAELDEDRRIALWHRAHEIIWQDQPYTFLMRNKTLAFVDRRMRGVETVPAGLNTGGLWRVPIEWYVPSAEQKYSR